MGVDGIGSGGSRPLGAIGTTAPRETGGAAPVGESAPSHRTAAASSAALESLARGEISLDAYVDQRVAEATRHLEGQAPPSEVAFIREALREQLATDPVLVELLQRTTGHPKTKIG